ncbi:MAG TPA: YcaO-like family protein [Blastocatellia bacterium]|nr:YcaO-like family protein [Blastocatellia bacterium]
MTRPSSSLRRLADVLDCIVDERVGIVRYVREAYRQAGEPDFFHFYAQTGNTKAFSRQESFSRTGGASVDRGLAIAKAVGEAVERYCGALYEVEELPLSSYDAAPFQCVAPEEFALYSAEQYASPDFMFVPFERDTPVRWTPARDPMTDEVWHVPAAMVFVPYYFYRETGDRPICQPISTGLACHCSVAEAALAAVCEVIERDAFTITWQARMARPHLRVETLSRENRDLVLRIERAGYRVTLFDMTSDVGVPAILAVSRSDAPEAPPLAVAGAASLAPEQAVRKSLEELEHTRAYCQIIKRHVPRLAHDALHRQVTDQQDHLNFWCDNANLPLADFLFASSERVAFGELANCATGHPARDLEHLVGRVRAAGHRVLLCDLTTPDVRELGLSVVRAIIPGFHPFFVGYGYRALGGTRLWEIPQTLGYPGISRESGDNPAPHPYP